MLAVGLSGGLAAGLTWFGYVKAAAGLRSKSELALGSESLLVTTLIDTWLNQRLTALRGIASLRCVRTVLETAVSLAHDDVDATNLALSDIAVVAPEIESIDVIDLRGGTIASTTDETQPRDLLQHPEVRTALGGRDFVSGVLVSPSTGAPCIYTSVPVRGSNGTVIGLVRARESIGRIQQLVAGSPRRIGATAQGVLLDRNGLVVATTLRGAVDLAPLRDTKSRRIFNWDLSGAQHVTVVEPVARADWSYGAALPLAVVESDARSFLRRAVTGALIGLAVAWVLALVVARRTVRAVHRLIRATRAIVSDNNLTQRIEVASDDEIGELADSFSRMVGVLREALLVLRSAAGSLLEAADQLQQTTEAEREFVTRQTAALQQTQVTAQEIKQTSTLAAEKAETVVRAAEGANEMGRSGEAALQESIAGLDEIRTRTNTIGEHLQALSEGARQIGGVTVTVKDLADQSNMLALNAAIEAVRSGEHAKGFSVVAREIRSLADQSLAATSRVGEILATVGSSIRTTTHMSEDAVRVISQGLARIAESGDTLRGLLGITHQNVASARQIAAAVQQQNAGIQQICVAVTEQLQMMQQTQVRLESTMAASATVRQQAAHLSSLLRRYQIE